MSIIHVPQNFDYGRYPGRTSTIYFKDFVLQRLRSPYLIMDNPTLGIDLEGEQKAARDDVVDWLIHPDVDDRVLAIGGLAGVGKAQPLDAVVYTPEGPKRMGDVHKGDIVSTPDGSTATVVGVFPQGKKQVYRFWFDDGCYADSSTEHLWRVIDRRRYSKREGYNSPEVVIETGEIVNGLAVPSDGAERFYIPTGVCYFNKKHLSISPYLMGVLLGDGGLKHSLSITSADREILDRCDILLMAWNCCLVQNHGDDESHWHIVGNNGLRAVDSAAYPLRQELRKLGLWGKGAEDKFIPLVYLESSLEDRWELLQGLMDTDGTAQRHQGMASFTSTSHKLALNVQWLVNSLGGKATIKPKKKWCIYKGVKVECDAWEVNTRMNETKKLFALERKKEIARDRTKYKTQRCIRRAEYMGEQECQCIMVDHPDHMYLTNFFIPTHNSILACHVQAYIQTLGLRCNVVSLTGKAVEVLRKKGMSNPETIHSCLYTKDNAESKRTGRLVFTKNYFLDYEIILIDEAQILSKQYYDDFLSFPYVRLIAIGDHGQLQAIGGDTIDLMKNPRIRLEEPRRQESGSNILQFAHALRTGQNIRFGKCPGVMIAPRSMFWKDIADPSFDQVIVGFNRTRHEVNRVIRRDRGFYGDIPNVGEKVICLYNNREIGIFNGQTFIVRGVQLVDDELLSMTLDDVGTIYTVIALKEQFGKDKIDLSYANQFHADGYHDVVFLDYAYAITAHKSMGSEFSRGKVLEECHRDTDVRRWSYTAATRFIDHVDYYR
jgi:hypothetical protein